MNAVQKSRILAKLGAVAPGSPVRAPGQRTSRLARLFMTYGAAIAWHVLVLLAMILDFSYEQPPIQREKEIAVEVAVVPPPPETPPQTPPQTATKTPPPAQGAPMVGEEDLKPKAPASIFTRLGQGREIAQHSAAVSAALGKNQEQDDPDPTKEISKIVPPRGADPTERPHQLIAAPGAETRATAAERPEARLTENQATEKRRAITCGALVRLPMPVKGESHQVEIIGVLTEAQRRQIIESSEQNSDLNIDPDYRGAQAFIVRYPDSLHGAAVAPQELAISVGDRVSVFGAHVDANKPCHFVPNVVVSVLAHG